MELVILMKIKITKTAVKILIVSLSAALGAFAFSFFAYNKDIPSYDLMVKIGIRIIVVGIISAATYDLVKRGKDWLFNYNLFYFANKHIVIVIVGIVGK